MSPAKLVAALISAIAITAGVQAVAQQSAPPPPADSGVVRIPSAYGMDETLVPLKNDIAAKGLSFFDEIDQAQLATGAGIKLTPSVLLIFRNPPLGIQFLTASPYSGLDWPVRMVVFEDGAGQVWMAYTDFDLYRPSLPHHRQGRSVQNGGAIRRFRRLQRPNQAVTT